MRHSRRIRCIAACYTVGERKLDSIDRRSNEQLREGMVFIIF